MYNIKTLSWLQKYLAKVGQKKKKKKLNTQNSTKLLLLESES